MPTYGYECLACHDQTEVFQSIKDAPLTVCEACGGTLRKRVYPVGIAFKGSGFYVNDYAAKPAASAAPATESKSEGASVEGAKAETAKAEAKTEAPKAEAKSPAPAAA